MRKGRYPNKRKYVNYFSEFSFTDDRGKVRRREVRRGSTSTSSAGMHHKEFCLILVVIVGDGLLTG